MVSGVRRSKIFSLFVFRRTFLDLATPVVLLLSFLLPGCVRVAGTAGSWHANPDGQVESRQAGFDTQKIFSKGEEPVVS